jgi:hypothetical protein
MHRKSLLIALAMVCIGVRFGYGAAPSYIVKRTGQTVTIDGKLDEKAWAGVDTISLKDCTSGNAVAQATKALALWDTSNLYLGIMTRDKDIWATLTQRDGGLYTEEVLEFFLDPDRDGKNYFEFEFNCRGALMDIFMNAPWNTTGGGGDPNWNCANISYKVATHGTVNNPSDVDTGMTLEVKIPWKDLKTNSYTVTRPRHGDRFAANIYRIDGRDASAKVYSCWNPVGGTLPTSFHSPALFGIFQFSDTLSGTTAAGSERYQIRNNGSDEMRLIRNSSGSVTVSFSLRAASNVTLGVYTLSGVCVRRIRKNAMDAGDHALEWNYRDAAGRMVAPGNYIVRLQGKGTADLCRIIYTDQM